MSWTMDGDERLTALHRANTPHLSTARQPRRVSGPVSSPCFAVCRLICFVVSFSAHRPLCCHSSTCLGLSALCRPSTFHRFDTSMACARADRQGRTRQFSHDRIAIISRSLHVIIMLYYMRQSRERSRARADTASGR